MQLAYHGTATVQPRQFETSYMSLFPLLQAHDGIWTRSLTAMPKLKSKSNIARKSPHDNCVPRIPSRRCLEKGVLKDSQHYQPFKFRHDILDDPERQIRLLRVLSSSDDDKEHLKTELSTWYLDKAPPYKAISYTWGDDSRRLIYVNEKCHVVTKNCAYALWQSSRHSPGAYIWIDSVCINQTGINEKNRQVKIMMSIYQKASQVLVCIGPHADNSELVYQFLWKMEELNAEAERDPSRCKDDNLPHKQHWKPWLATLSKSEVDELYPALTNFFERPYWKRLWIVQEYVAAVVDLEVLCETRVLSWPQMKLLSELPDMVQRDFPGGLHRVSFPPWISRSLCELVQIRDAVNSGDLDGLEIFDLISFQDRECKDPRDRVFGLLGLVKWPEGVEPIIPNYHESTIQLALRMAQVLQKLQTIRHVLRALGVDRHHPEIQAWVTERNHKIPRPGEHCGVMDGRHDVRQISLSFENPMQAQFLEARDDGQLTSSFIEEEEDTGTSRHTARLREVMNRRRYPCRYVFVSSNVAALVCESARVGDLVVVVPNNVYVGALFLMLVLRHDSTDDVWDVVGNGFLFPGFHVGYITASDCPGKVASWVYVDVKLTPKDIILLTEIDIRNSATRLERLAINPATFPKGAAKVTFKATSEN